MHPSAHELHLHFTDDGPLAVELHRAIAPSALWVVPNGGHTPIFGDARAEFERIALDFLRA